MSVSGILFEAQEPLKHDEAVELLIVFEATNRHIPLQYGDHQRQRGAHGAEGPGRHCREVRLLTFNLPKPGYSPKNPLKPSSTPLVRLVQALQFAPSNTV
jgi:hypothetical protein